MTLIFIPVRKNIHECSFVTGSKKYCDCCLRVRCRLMKNDNTGEFVNVFMDCKVYSRLRVRYGVRLYPLIFNQW